MRHPVSVLGYRSFARARLPRIFFDYLDGGANDEITIHENHTAYQKVLFNRHILKDVAHTSTTINLFGHEYSQPVVLAPIGFAGLYARRAEKLAAQAAQAEQVPFCLSTLSICSIEEVRSVVSQPFWFQYYMPEDRSLGFELIKRAQFAGCPVLVFTVDVPIFGTRYKDMRHGVFGNQQTQPTLGKKLQRLWQYLSHPHWFWDVLVQGGPHKFGNFPEEVADFQRISNYRITLSWDDLEWVRSNWPGKLVVKGVQNLDDARRAVAMGVDGIVVSNHAGRHLDSTPPAIKLLPLIAKPLRDQVTILIDGGVFSGQDVLKALALGAHACMIGRGFMYALAARGQEGVKHVLSMMRSELEISMIQLGLANISDIYERNLVTYET